MLTVSPLISPAHRHSPRRLGSGTGQNAGAQRRDGEVLRATERKEKRGGQGGWRTEEEDREDGEEAGGRGGLQLLLLLPA